MTLPPIKAWLFDQLYWPEYGLQHPFPPDRWDAETGMAQYREHLRYLTRADELGFDGICLTEHHFTPYGLASPNVFAGAVAALTKRAKIVIMGNILPLHSNPVRLAEELAILDVLSQGRLVSGLMRGGFTEWYSYRIDPTNVREKFEEAWELIVACFERQEAFDWDGRFFQYKGISIVPRGVQKPHPALVMTASTAESIEWAARKRVPMACSFAPTDSMAQNYAYYREYAETQCGWSPGPEYAIFSRQTYVAETDEQAREEAWPHLKAFWDDIPVARPLAPEVEKYRDAGKTKRSFDYKKGGAAGGAYLMEVLKNGVPSLQWLLDEGLAIVGSPKSVVAQIRRQQEAFKAATVLVYTPFGTLPPEMATKSMELFAQQVLPELSKTVETAYA